jgi:PTH1 family peptidyl-tRNA hydrolase
VLTPFPAALRDDLALEVSRTADAVEMLILHGLESAQNTFNS